MIVLRPIIGQQVDTIIVMGVFIQAQMLQEQAQPAASTMPGTGGMSLLPLPHTHTHQCLKRNDHETIPPLHSIYPLDSVGGRVLRA